MFLAFGDEGGDPALEASGTYYLNVRATDLAGLTSEASSDGITVDLSPPVAGTVEHGLRTNPEPSPWQRNTKQAELRWDDFVDPESGMYQFDFGLATEPMGGEDGNPDAAAFSFAGTGTQAVVSGVSLQHRHIYYGVVKSMNGVGLETVGYSDGVMVDTTPPTCSLVDGVLCEGCDDVDLTTHTELLAFVDCTDVESGIGDAVQPSSGNGGVYWGIGTLPGMLDVQDLTWVDTHIAVEPSLADLDGLNVTSRFVPRYRRAHLPLRREAESLLDGLVYYTTVLVFNNAMDFTWAVGDGIKFGMRSLPLWCVYARCALTAWRGFLARRSFSSGDSCRSTRCDVVRVAV